MGEGVSIMIVARYPIPIATCNQKRIAVRIMHHKLPPLGRGLYNRMSAPLYLIVTADLQKARVICTTRGMMVYLSS